MRFRLSLIVVGLATGLSAATALLTACGSDEDEKAAAAAEERRRAEAASGQFEPGDPAAQPGLPPNAGPYNGPPPNEEGDPDPEPDSGSNPDTGTQPVRDAGSDS